MFVPAEQAVTGVPCDSDKCHGGIIIKNPSGVKGAPFQCNKCIKEFSEEKFRILREKHEVSKGPP
ncbi:MAG: hypothetical protein Q8N37_01240 [bacterium]|nr:hypothetical protein [bacterium]